jgi:hypothetical protein
MDHRQSYFRKPTILVESSHFSFIQRKAAEEASLSGGQ